MCVSCILTEQLHIRLSCRNKIIQQEAMDKTIAPANTPQQKASGCIIEELWRSPWKGMGAPQQQTNDVVPPCSESTHAYADEQSANETSLQSRVQPNRQSIPESEAQRFTQFVALYVGQPVAQHIERYHTQHTYDPNYCATDDASHDTVAPRASYAFIGHTALLILDPFLCNSLQEARHEPLDEPNTQPVA